MYFELIWIGICFTTQVTAIRSFSCMGPPVGSEKISPFETFTTIAANVGLLSVVSLDVDIEQGYLAKCFRT